MKGFVEHAKMSVNVKSCILISYFFALEGVCLFYSSIEYVYMLLPRPALIAVQSTD